MREEQGGEEEGEKGEIWALVLVLACSKRNSNVFERLLMFLAATISQNDNDNVHSNIPLLF